MAIENKRKVCIIGQFPPPLHGLSKALDTLCEGVKDAFCLQKIDIKDNRKVIGNLFKLLFSKADVFYLTLSQSKWGNWRDLLFLKLISLKKKKCLVHLHGGYYRALLEALSPGQKRKNEKMLQKIQGAIVLSPSLRSVFQSLVPDEKIFVVENCADDQYLLPYTAIEQRLQTASQRGKYNVLYLSNFQPEKGYKEVLALAKYQNEQAKDSQKFHFHFAGQFVSPAQEKEFFDYIAANALKDSVTYHGVVDGAQKLALLKTGDFFILPTRYPKEGLPISLLECMGNGMAAVTTDHAAICDVVTDGQNGVLLAENQEKDAKAVYQKMLCLIESLPQIASNNYHKIRTQYTQARYISQLEALFLNI